jgi:hypothetical protein
LPFIEPLEGDDGLLGIHTHLKAPNSLHPLDEVVPSVAPTLLLGSELAGIDQVIDMLRIAAISRDSSQVMPNLLLEKAELMPLQVVQVHCLFGILGLWQLLLLEVGDKILDILDVGHLEL